MSFLGKLLLAIAPELAKQVGLAVREHLERKRLEDGEAAAEATETWEGEDDADVELWR